MCQLTDMPRGPRCPFYGFHWPPGSNNLKQVGTPECGLDLDGQGLCRMETEQRPVDFEICARRWERKNLIDAGRKYLRFHGAELPGAGVPLELLEHEVMQQK